MRVIWVIGDLEAASLEAISKAMSQERTGMQYLVRIAHAPEEIPPSHMENPGVVAFLNSFHPKLPGFEGLKKLRSLGFKGAVYLFGEPAPESAVEPFKHLGLNGYFPPFDRADFYFVCGLVHYQLHFDGKIDLTHFLGPAGRSASETLRTLKDFNSFGAKLANFIGRFGLDLGQLRKTLMGLSLAHVKTSSGTPSIEQPFVIHYGMDPQKVILAAPAFAKGASKEVLLSEFSEALGSVKAPQGNLHSSMFPEIHHVARAAENLIILSGSNRGANDSMDPMMLMTTLTFPSSKGAVTAPVYIFAFAHARPTDELSEQVALETVENQANHESVIATLDHPALDSAPEGTIEEIDVTKLLSEDLSIVGDTPVLVSDDQSILAESPHSETPAGANTEADVGGETNGASAVDPETHEKLLAAERELNRLKETLSIMGQDIRRLMKERRQPTTDRELRDAYTHLEEKLKKVSAEKIVLHEQLVVREKQIEILQNQIRAKAAA